MSLEDYTIADKALWRKGVEHGEELERKRIIKLLNAARVRIKDLDLEGATLTAYLIELIEMQASNET